MSAGSGWQDYAPQTPPPSGDGWQDFQPKAKAAPKAQGMPLAPTAWGRMKQAYEGTLPILDYDTATLSGVGSIARGMVGGAKGAYNTLKEAVGAWNDPHADVGDTVLPDPHVEQVPGAVRDINASPDPTGTYLKAAGETAGQGAGAAIDALAMEGAGRVLPKVPGALSDAASSLSPKAKALGKLGLQDAASHIPVAGRLVRRPSLLDYVKAAQTKAPTSAAPEPLDATGPLGGNRDFAGGVDEYTPPPFKNPGAKLPQNPGAKFLRENQGVYPGAPEPTATPEQLNPSLSSPSRSLPGQISPEVIRPPAQPLPARPGLALPPGPEAAPAAAAEPAPPRLVDQIRESTVDQAPPTASPTTYSPRTRLLDQIRDQARQIQSQVSSDEPPAPVGRQLRIAGQDVDPNTDLTDALQRSMPGKDPHPVTLVRDAEGNILSQDEAGNVTDGRHRIIQAIQRGDPTIAVRTQMRDGSYQTLNVPPARAAKMFGVTKESLAATDAQQPYRAGNLRPRPPAQQ